jgi:uncharacterized protein YqhQ
MEGKMNEKKSLSIGGQAVIEGVVMRGPRYIATAVRRKDNSIEVKKEEYISITQKNKFLGLPIIRGFVSLIEVLIIGVKTLQFSADRAELDMEEEVKKDVSKRKEKVETFITFLVAFGLAFGIFTYLPYQIAYLVRLSSDSIIFNLFTGIVRIIFFVAYVKGISLIKDVQRLFEYHGAEHKTVHAYENGDELTSERVDNYTTIHPRCGTSFIFLVLLISILIFALLDTAYSALLGTPSLLVRIGYHLLFMPLISGVSYEVLKFSGKNMNSPLVRLFTVPGMLLQKITTKNPSFGQLEVAMVSLRSALELPQPSELVINYVEDPK